MSQTRKIRWLLYHEPIELFVRTAVAFSEEIKRLTDDRIQIEVFTITEYLEKFGKSIKDPMALIADGKIEMSQVQLNKLTQWQATDFSALELPFLFTDHDHATRVLEGDIGKQLFKHLEEVTPVTGLAFTYSGGYRVFASDTTVRTAEDLKGLSMTVSTNPVIIDTAMAFGCTPVPIADKDTTEESNDAKRASNGIETTLPRYENEVIAGLHTNVIDTKHSMYLTSIIISTDFWNSLDAADQAAMRTAALNSSRLERQWSIDDAHAISGSADEQQRLGITYFEMPAAEVDKLKESVKHVYSKYEQFFTPGLVDGIIRA